MNDEIPPKPTGPPPMPDNIEQLMAEAMEKAFEGKGWSNEQEREEYLAKISADDYLPAIFCETSEEVEKSGMSDALSSLLYEGEDPGRVMLEFKKKGNDAFTNGKRNVSKNVQYYRDAINHYHEALGWCDKINIKDDDDDNDNNNTSTDVKEGKEEDIPEFTNSEAGKIKTTTNEEVKTNEEEIKYTKEELQEIQSTLYSNIALSHLQIKNYGYSRKNAQKAVEYNQTNIKAWYRLAKSQQMLKNYVLCGDAIESGLKIDNENMELRKLSNILSTKIQIARNELKLKQKARIERISTIKRIWKHCVEKGIQIGRIPLLSMNDVTDLEEDDNIDTNAQETTWKYNLPFSGKLPSLNTSKEWTWPCLFIYPSHSQSDFIECMPESDMIALQLATMFPELERDEDNNIPWDYKNEFTCGNLEIYIEIHQCNRNTNKTHHPESIQIINNQQSCIKFYECCRAIQGDDGSHMIDIVTTLERKRLSLLKKEYLLKEKKKFVGYLPSSKVIRIHPAATLYDVLKDDLIIVPNVSFLYIFIVSALSFI